MTINFASHLFAGTPIQPLPAAFDFGFNFPITSPNGICRVRLARGNKNGQDALIWETVVVSEGDDLLRAGPEDFSVWLQSAHAIVHDLFFKMISGSLEDKLR